MSRGSLSRPKIAAIAVVLSAAVGIAGNVLADHWGWAALAAFLTLLVAWVLLEVGRARMAASSPAGDTVDVNSSADLAREVVISIREYHRSQQHKTPIPDPVRLLAERALGAMRTTVGEDGANGWVAHLRGDGTRGERLAQRQLSGWFNEYPDLRTQVAGALPDATPAAPATGGVSVSVSSGSTLSLRKSVIAGYVDQRKSVNFGGLPAIAVIALVAVLVATGITAATRAAFDQPAQAVQSTPERSSSSAPTTTASPPVSISPVDPTPPFGGGPAPTSAPVNTVAIGRQQLHLTTEQQYRVDLEFRFRGFAGNAQISTLDQQPGQAKVSVPLAGVEATLTNATTGHNMSDRTIGGFNVGGLYAADRPSCALAQWPFRAEVILDTPAGTYCYVHYRDALWGSRTNTDPKDTLSPGASVDLTDHQLGTFSLVVPEPQAQAVADDYNKPPDFYVLGYNGTLTEPAITCGFSYGRNELVSVLAVEPGPPLHCDGKKNHFPY